VTRNGHSQVLVLQGAKQLTHFGRHQRKLDLVSGSETQIVQDDTATTHAAVRAWSCRASMSRVLLSLQLPLMSTTDAANAGLFTPTLPQGMSLARVRSSAIMPVHSGKSCLAAVLSIAASLIFQCHSSAAKPRPL